MTIWKLLVNQYHYAPIRRWEQQLNGCGVSISVTERRCATPISKRESHWYRRGFVPYFGARGAGSEVWNRVYMIAPVKKFGRVRLSTIFLQNKYGGECRHGGTMSFCSVLSFPASKHQEKVFKNILNGIFGHQEAWCMNSSWVTTLSMIRHLGKFSYL